MTLYDVAWILFFAYLVLAGAGVFFYWGDGRSPGRSTADRDAPASRGTARPAMGTDEVNFWAERYLALDVGALAGCTFEQYLRRPMYYERIARARNRLRERRRRCQQGQQPRSSRAEA